MDTNTMKQKSEENEDGDDNDGRDVEVFVHSDRDSNDNETTLMIDDRKEEFKRNELDLNNNNNNNNNNETRSEQASFSSDMEMQRGDPSKYRNLLCPIAWQFGVMFLSGYYVFAIGEPVIGVLCMTVAICYNCFVCWKQQLAAESFTTGDYIISSKITFQVQLLLIPAAIIVVLAIVLTLDYLFTLIV